MQDFRNTANHRVMWQVIHRYVEACGGAVPAMDAHAPLVAEINAAVAAIADAVASRVAAGLPCFQCGNPCTQGRVVFLRDRVFCSDECAAPYARGL